MGRKGREDAPTVPVDLFSPWLKFDAETSVHPGPGSGSQQMHLSGEVAGCLGPGPAPGGMPGHPGPGIPMPRGWSQGDSCPGGTMAPLGDGWRTKALLSGIILYAHMWPLPEMTLWKASLSWRSAFKCSGLRRLLNLSSFFSLFFFFWRQMPQERSCADNKVVPSSFWSFNRAIQ